MIESIIVKVSPSKIRNEWLRLEVSINKHGGTVAIESIQSIGDFKSNFDIIFDEMKARLRETILDKKSMDYLEDSDHNVPYARRNNE